MASFTIDDYKASLGESFGSWKQYKTYLNYLKTVNAQYDESATDLVPYLNDPNQLCMDLRDKGLDYEKCKNLLKALKRASTEAVKKGVKLDKGVVKQLDAYITKILNVVYSAEVKQATTSNQKQVVVEKVGSTTESKGDPDEASEGVDDGDLTDGDVSEEEMNHKPSNNRPVNDSLNKKLRDLERRLRLQEEKSSFLDSILIALIEQYPGGAPKEIVKLLYQTSVATFR